MIGALRVNKNFDIFSYFSVVKIYYMQTHKNEPSETVLMHIPTAYVYMENLELCRHALLHASKVLPFKLWATKLYIYTESMGL